MPSRATPAPAPAPGRDDDASGPPPPRVGSALDDVNDGFHGSYDGARDQTKLEGPVLIALADELIVFRGEKRRTLHITPRIFHVIKSVAHAPVALYAALHRPSDGASLSALREHVAASLAALEAEKDAEPATLEDLRSVLRATLAFAERADAAAPEAAGLDAFAKEQGEALLRLTTAATRVQLASLDAGVEEALADLSAEERGTLQVVVTGDHQARVRSLGMQYFRKRLGESDGEEARVTYAEGVADADEALALVGKRRLDNAIARAFFGDAKRLQHDVLGDAVHDLLATADLARIA